MLAEDPYSSVVCSNNAVAVVAAAEQDSPPKKQRRKTSNKKKQASSSSAEDRAQPCDILTMILLINSCISLLRSEETNEKIHVTLLLSQCVHLLSSTLVQSDRSKLDKLASGSGASASLTSKTILMHAVVSIVVGSMTALTTIPMETQEENSNSLHIAYWQILASMEYVISMSSSHKNNTAAAITTTEARSSTSELYYNEVLSTASAEKHHKNTNEFSNNCNRTDMPPPSITYTSSMFSSPDWLSQLFLAEEDNTTSVNRVESILHSQCLHRYTVLQYRLAHRNENKSLTDEECYSYILHKYSMEARISYRRWASIILIHPCFGVNVVLTRIQEILHAEPSIFQTTRINNIPGNVLRIVYVSKWIDLLRHATSLVGHYPTNSTSANALPKFSGMDTYAATILGSHSSEPTSIKTSPFPIMEVRNTVSTSTSSSSKPKRRSARSSSSSSSRSNKNDSSTPTSSNTNEDINITGLCGMRVMSSLIKAHLDCMEENHNEDVSSNIIFGPEFINFHDEQQPLDIYSCLTFYFPFILRTMASLSMLVRDHSSPLPTPGGVGSRNTNSSSFQEIHRELGASIFYGIPPLSDIVCKMDWYSKLMTYGCALAFCNKRQVTDGKLLTLSVTILLMALQEFKSEQLENPVEHSGMDVLSRFLCEIGGGTNTSNADTCTEFTILLMSAIQSCYMELATPSRSPAGYTRDALILMVRSLLKALRHVLEILPHPVTNSSTVPVFDFTGSKMRIFSFWIENMHHNCGIFNNTSSTPDDDAAEQSSYAQFSLYERMLWSDHIKVCLVIGRGRASPTPPFQISEANQLSISKPCLINSSTRLDALKIIAKYLVKSNGYGARIEPSTWRWPLVMPLAFHAILLSNLASERLAGSVEEVDPERFLVNAFMHSLEDATSTEEAIGGSKTNREHVFLLWDARLFVLALIRLPREEFVEKTRRIILLFSKFVSSIHSSGFSRVSGFDAFSSAVAGFLSRILVVISTLFDLLQAPISYAVPIAMNLAKAASTAHYHVPEVEDFQKSYHDEECSWYVREQCFMGLFMDWECPFVPCPLRNVSSTGSDIELKPSEKLSVDDISCFHRLLDRSLAMGFCTAPADKCLLIYSSWNAGAKARPLTVEGWWKGSPAEAIESYGEIDQCANTLFIIRDLLTSLYCSLNSPSLTHQPIRQGRSLLREALWKSQQQYRGCYTKSTMEEASENLENHMTKSSQVIETQVQRLNLRMDERTPPIYFAVLDAAIVYLNFIIAQHSIPKEDCIESMRAVDSKLNHATAKLCREFSEGESGQPKRKNTLSSAETHTTNMSRSDCEQNVHGICMYDQDTDDEEEDAKMDALARLHDACATLGAAPVHPDWLDLTSRLRNCIDPSLAVRRAEKALTLLVTVGRLAHEKHQCLFAQILLRSSACKNTTDYRNAALAGNVLSALPVSDGEYYTANEASQCEDIEGKIHPSNDSISPYSICDLSGFPTMEEVKSKLSILLPNIYEGLNSKPGKARISNLTSEVKSVWSSECSSHVIWGNFHKKSYLDGSMGEDEQDLSVPLYTGDIGCLDTSLAEMRAAEEWELMLGRSLISGMYGDKDLDELEAEKEQWANILWSICDALVSSCALLRLGWNNGNGRSSKHPLCSKVVDGLSRQRLHLGLDITKECLPSDHLAVGISHVSSPTLSTTISSVLGFCAEICSDSLTSCQTRKSCHVACAHIISDDPMEFADLVAVCNVHRSIKILRRLIEINDNLDFEGDDNQAESGEKRVALLRLVDWLLVWLDSNSNRNQNRPFDDIIEACIDPKVSSKYGFNDNSRCTECCEISTCQLSSNTTPQKGPKNLRGIEGLFYSLKIHTLWSGDESSFSTLADILPRHDMNVGNLISMFVALLCDKKRFPLSLNGRARISRQLCGLLRYFTSQKNTDLLQSFANAFGLLPDDSLRNVVFADVCLMSANGAINDDEDIEKRVNLSRRICFIFCHLVNYENFSKVAFETIQECIDCLVGKWADPRGCLSRNAIHEECVMKLFFLLALCRDKLFEVGASLLGRAKGFTLDTLYQPESALADLPGVKPLGDFFGLLLLAHNYIRTSTDSAGDIKITDRDSSASKGSIVSTTNEEDATTRSWVEFPRTCSYVETNGDFRSQHWYNCYTCDLVWEKGCCSLCAAVCHKGHDVGYSRKSSFFCDCGAKEANGDQVEKKVNRATTSTGRFSKAVQCKCLNEISHSQLEQLHQEVRIRNEGGGLTFASTICKIPAASPVEASNSPKECTTFFCDEGEEIIPLRCIIYSFSSKADASLRNFCREASSSNWSETIESFFLSHLKLWKSHCNLKASIYLQPCAESTGQREISFGEEEAAARSHISCLFSGEALSLQPLLSQSMIPIRAAKSAAINAKFINEPSADRIQRSILAKRGIHRKIIAADSRGRLIVAELCSLLFCTAIPSINSRHVEKSLETPLERSQLSILGTAKLKFPIVGVILHPKNDQYLLVYGTSKACALVLNYSCDKIENQIELELDIVSDADVEFICQCDWVPGSESLIAVVFGTYIKVFDMKKATPSGPLSEKEFSARSTTKFSLAFEDVIIKAAVFIPMGIERHFSENSFLSKVRLVVLLETGRMYTVEWRLDASGNLEDQGETYLECGEGLRFPSERIRRYPGAAPCHPGSTATTLGDGSHLFYLKQSDLLLYKCVSAPMVAMRVNTETGLVLTAFELLPNVISSEILGSGVDDYSISAPYTHITELGMYQTQSNGKSLLTFRIACIGKSTRTNLPKLICVEFNEEGVKAKELKWPSGMSSVGLGLSLTSSADGVAAFSAPFLIGESKHSQQGFLTNQERFYERAYLAVVMSNGCVLFYGEDPTEVDSTKLNKKSCVNQGSLLWTSEGCNKLPLSENKTVQTAVSQNFTWRSILAKNNEPTFPLQVFETLLNITDGDFLFFGGDGVGIDADSAKNKLSISNSEFVVSPSREGCTFTLSLGKCRSRKYSKDESKKKKRSDYECESNMAKYVIVAVRVLVGSAASESLPRQITLMGRPIKLVQGAKRWYDLPLTDEEICLAVRSGFVCMNISSCYDIANTPCVDAIEAYVLERSQIKFLNSLSMDSPPSAKYFVSPCPRSLIGLNVGNEKDSKTQNSKSYTMLIVAMKCMTNLFTLLREHKLSQHVGGFKGSATRKALQSLLQVAIFSPSSDEIRLQVHHALEQIEPDDFNRQVIIDESVLVGIEEALTCIKEEFNEDVLDIDVGSNSSSVQLNDRTHLILSLLCKCIELSLPVARDRSRTYVRILMKNSANDAAPACTIASQIREVLKSVPLTFSEIPLSDRWTVPPSIKQDFSLGNALDRKYEEVLSLLVELSVFEMAAGMRQQQRRAEKKALKFADFSLISELFHSQGQQVVKHCCYSIAKVEEALTRFADDAFVAREGSCNQEYQNPIAYQCDGCELFPITSIRYTLDLEDIDLCEKCYAEGYKFASGTDQQEAVKIEAKRLRLGRNRELTCSQIRKMRALPVEDMKEDQVEQARDRLVAGEILNHDFDRESIVSESNLHPLSLLAEEIFDSVVREAVAITFFQLEEITMDGKVSQISPPVCGSDGANTILTLLIHLTMIPCTEGLRMLRRKKLGEALTYKLSSLVKQCIENSWNEEDLKKAQVSIALAMKTLTSLLLFEDTFYECVNDMNALNETDEDVAANRTRGKVHSKLRCNVHGIPAVRRRWSHGVNKNRRFYVCGMPKHDRCGYFSWAIDGADASPIGDDESTQQKDLSSEGSSHGEMKLFFRTLFSRPGTEEEGAPPLQSLFCNLLQKVISISSDLRSIFSDSDEAPSRSVPSTKVYRYGAMTLEKYRDDMQDGAHISRAKFGWLGKKTIEERYRPPQLSPLNTSILAKDNGVKDYFIQTALDLLSRLAQSTPHSEENNDCDSWSTGWYPLLCEIISTSKSSLPLNASQAKLMLKKLCGCRKVTYHRVRDHYVFALQFRKLLYYFQGPLRAGLDACERAQCCMVGYESKANLNDVCAGGMFGVSRLVSEDSLSGNTWEKLHHSLTELTTLALSRPFNWRRFCALPQLPQWKRGDVDYPIEDESYMNRSPILLLLWMSSCVCDVSSQACLLRLINVSLNPDNDVMVSCEAWRGNFLNAEDVSKNTVGTKSTQVLGSDTSGLDHRIISILDGDILSSPESVLLSSDSSLSVDSIFSFVMEFVLYGKSSEVRLIASNVAQILILRLADAELTSLVSRFLGTPVSEVGPLGATSTEYFQFICSILTSSSLCGASTIIYSLVASFVNQNKVCCSFVPEAGYGTIEAEIEPGKVVQKHFDLSSCVHCHGLDTEIAKSRRIESAHSKETGVKSAVATLSESTSLSCEGTSGGEKVDLPTTSTKNNSAGVTEVKWLPQQIRPYTRFRLDSCSVRVGCTEFATYVQLKSRLALSEINLIVSDPRGRFVKTIAIFFSPRTVAEVSDLKSAEYSHIWQRCGTLSLAKGSLRASCVLKSPVVAANLKFEYKDFYEKVGARTSNGLVCPRCTRIVNNSHGVCGSCGEVAFQCRKCRHINYDKLDAFFCVECGHCSSGSQFTYEISAGLASNAISILDDVDFERTMNLFRIAMKRHGEARNALRKRLLAYSSESQVSSDSIENLNDVDEEPSLKRALVGELPKYSGTGRSGGDSSVSSTTSAERSRIVEGINRTRSLISLARQMQGEESDRPAEHLMRRALLASIGGGIEFFEDEYFRSGGSGLLNSMEGSILQSEIPYPLSRLMANIQRVREGATDVTRGPELSRKRQLQEASGQERTNESGAVAQSSKTVLEDLERLHRQLREYEKECYELHCCVAAWQRLNQGYLAYSEPAMSTARFVPSTCSCCAPKVAVSLLKLLVAIFEKAKVDVALSKQFVNALIEPSMLTNGELDKLKKQAIVKTVVATASTSETLALVVLEELRKRLMTTKDATCAEILGLLLKEDFPLVGRFLELAVEIM